MENPVNSYQLDKLRQEELMRMAEQFRLAQVAAQGQRTQRLYDHVLASTGGLLVKWGHVLQERYGTMAELRPGASQTSSSASC